MSTARFSPFELLLLNSRSQVDTAILLLLAWVLVQRQHISEGQRHRRLAQVSAHFRHGHELEPVMQIAHRQDMQAIQLAAEIVHRECSPPRSMTVIQQAIALAGDHGNLCHANHYILHFLADLLGIKPDSLKTLYKELTGAILEAPEDMSTQAYWRQYDPHHDQRQAQQQAAADKAREDAAAAAQQREQARQQRRAEKQRKRQERADQKAEIRAQREKARQEKARQAQARREQKRQENARREKTQQEKAQHEKYQQYSRQESARQPSIDRTARALAVLGLGPGASRSEIRRAYRKMAQLHHPDRFFSQSDQQIALASARFQRIKNAYDYLSRRGESS
ncbi:MAG: DnaJ domain-containing protein [Pseudomonadota bacterium]